MLKVKAPKKLIEVALPLDDINAEAAREKSIRHGHPSTLHLWWARRPLAAARAVLFAQLVNDPGGERGYKPGMTKEQAQKERERLFDIMRRLVKWENSNNEEVLREAREEIWKSWRETCEMNKGLPGFDPDKLPAFHDPFAGGGSIPLEAQRLGLEAYASDLNPVAVLINKALIEIPPKFAGKPPVNPEARSKFGLLEQEWQGARGLAEDILYYGKWMRDEAFKRIGHLYPQVELPLEHGGGKAAVIAWIWARTVKSPNPAYSHVDVPLVSTFYLSKRPGKEVYIEPIIEGDTYRFEVRYGKPRDPQRVARGTKLARRANFECILSGSPISPDYVKAEGIAGRMGKRLIAVVVEGRNGRMYLSPQPDMERIANEATPNWRPEIEIPGDRRSMFTPLYGLTHFHHLFTNRQLVALSTFSELVSEAREKVYQDARSNGLTDDELGLEDGGGGVRAYADAIAVYLALAVDRLADRLSSIASWDSSRENIRNTFSRQAIPMVWDFAEAYPFSDSTGNWMSMVEWVWRSVENTPVRTTPGGARLADAQTQSLSMNKVVSTDPPYYDNIGYADLSDFFYVWLRRSLHPILPGLFATVAVPKRDELVATPYRHGTKEQANSFFMQGMSRAMTVLAQSAHPGFPLTIYYAFKQSDTDQEGTSSVGWVAFLEALIKAGFSITGTWPLRTEMTNRILGKDSNTLASSIVIVCRQRANESDTISRRNFLRELNTVIPNALSDMLNGGPERSPIAAVDLQQAAIGPGMAVFSKYAAVLEADGSPMTVKTALQLINRVVDAYLHASDGEVDAETLFCINWFDQFGWSEADFGRADVLARAKGTSVDAIRAAGILSAGHGKVRLLRWQEYPSDWRPVRDHDTPVWEALHHLIRALQLEGEQVAGSLLAGMYSHFEAIRSLAYRLYTLCERKGWAEDARAYNELIASWDAIDEMAQQAGLSGTQLTLNME